MKKKLLVIVGAGASLDFGLPSVSEVDDFLDEKASEQYQLESAPDSNLYRHFRDQIQAYFNKNPKTQMRKKVNFEEVLYQLNLLASFYSDPSYLHGSKSLLQPNSLPKVKEPNGKIVDGGSVLGRLSTSLIDEVFVKFTEYSNKAAEEKSNEIGRLTAFLDDLRKEFEIGIFTLNYDNLFTQACPDLYTGFDASNGIFQPRSIFNRQNWEFIYHLHGSIHFSMHQTLHDLHEIKWVGCLDGYNHRQAVGRNPQTSLEGPEYPTSGIIAGYGKTHQLLRQPFRTFYSQLDRHICEADSFLFLGYGFGDIHLNSAFYGVRAQPRPTVIVDWAEDKQDCLQHRMDEWSYNLFKTIPTNSCEMSAEGRRAPVMISELKTNKAFEVSHNPDYPLAVWYSGMLEACNNSSEIIKRLKCLS